MQFRNKSLRYILILAFMVAIFATAMGSLAMAAGDITAPAVTNVVPANGSTIYTNSGSTIYYQSGNATPLVIKADYNDEVGGSGVDPASVMVHLDGSNMLSDCPVQTESHVECNATAADLFPGTHPLDIYVADIDGNLTVNHTTLTVAVDNAAPSYTNLAPASGSTIYTSQLNSISINDLSALRIDYDLSDAAPSSGYSPMTHLNDNFPPGGTMGAMISNSSCVKTPATNPTHSSCQANRAALLHLGENRLSVLLKDKVSNSNYLDPSSVNSYTVVDDVAPVVSGMVADSTNISANYIDPLPTGALSASLASGINASTAKANVDGTTIMVGCTTTVTGISCPTPSGLSVGTHAIEITMDDNAGNRGIVTGSLTIDPPACTPAKPHLHINTNYAFWASYADYTARELSVKLTVSNVGTTTGYGVAITGSTNITNGVTLSTAPIALGDIAASGSAATVVKYHIPVGVTGFSAIITGSASDTCGTGYTYP